jgi:hypothetical protein
MVEEKIVHGSRFRLLGRALSEAAEIGGFQETIAGCDVFRTCAATGCPCPVAGRSLPASSLQLTRRRLRSGILPALAVYAGSRGTGTPPDFCAMSRETGGFQEKIARCDVFREADRQDAERSTRDRRFPRKNRTMRCFS